MQPVIGILMFFSVLIPQKVWFAPDQALNVTIKSEKTVPLLLTDFSGKELGTAQGPAGQTVDLKKLFAPLSVPGTYLLFAGSTTDFAGTPLVIEVRYDKDPGAPPGPMVIKVEPLRYAEMTTEMGKLTCIFYYDVAPLTVDSFLDLGQGGFYDGLTFHRVVPGFVIQGGDPRGDGTGGPGYSVAAEFNTRPHKEGALSMARSSDPNSAGSQFFVCLDYAGTQQLDGKYTVFGQVTDGMDAVKKIAAVNVPDPTTGRPDKPPEIQKMQVLSVTKDHNPYSSIFGK